MSDITVVSQTQRIVLEPPTTSIVAEISPGQNIVVYPPSTNIAVINAGPPGPPVAPVSILTQGGSRIGLQNGTHYLQG